MRGSKSTLVLCVDRKLLGFNLWIKIDLFFSVGIGIDLVFCVQAEIDFFNCDDRLTWFLCGWWSKLTRFLDAGRKSLGFSVASNLTSFLCEWSKMT